MCLAADKGFQCVAQGVQPGIGSQSARHAHGQLKIHQRRHRHQAEPHAEHFFLGYCVGDNRGPRDLGPGTRGGWYGNHRQAAGHRCRHRVVAHDAAVPRQHGSRLGGIQRTPATERHQAIEIAFLQHGEARRNAVSGWVWHTVGKYRTANTGLHQRGQQPLGKSLLRQIGVRHQQWACQIQLPQGIHQRFTGTGADAQDARQVHTGRHHAGYSSMPSR